MSRNLSLRVLRALLLVAACGLLLPTGRAAEALVGGDTELRADRFIDAAVLRRLAAGTRVELLRNEGGWTEVRIDGRTGWVRASALGGEGAQAAATARMETGRAAPGNVVMVAGIRAVPQPGRHALIVTIGETESSSVPLLAGAERDAESARTLAVALGVPEANIRMLRDREALAERIRGELAAISDRVPPDGRVYLHLSAHGTRGGAEGPRPCGPAWLSSDGVAVTAAELAGWLRPLAGRVDRLVVVIDAGAGPPAMPPPRRGGLQSRFVEPPDAAARCPASAPVAAAGPALAASLRDAGFRDDGFAVVLSAGAGQASWEDPLAGGWASEALSACVAGAPGTAGAARTAAAVTAGTADEARTLPLADTVACAQSRVARRAGERGVAAPDLQLLGDRGFLIGR